MVGNRVSSHSRKLRTCSVIPMILILATSSCGGADFGGTLAEIEPKYWTVSGRVGRAGERVEWSWVGHLHLSEVHGERSEDVEQGRVAGLEAQRGRGAKDKATARKSREPTPAATVHVLRPRRELRRELRFSQQVIRRALGPILRFVELIMGTIRITAPSQTSREPRISELDRMRTGGEIACSGAAEVYPSLKRAAVMMALCM